jgi:hypothetical protein
MKRVLSTMAVSWVFPCCQKGLFTNHHWAESEEKMKILKAYYPLPNALWSENWDLWLDRKISPCLAVIFIHTFIFCQTQHANVWKYVCKSMKTGFSKSYILHVKMTPLRLPFGFMSFYMLRAKMFIKHSICMQENFRRIWFATNFKRVHHKILLYRWSFHALTMRWGCSEWFHNSHIKILMRKFSESGGKYCRKM